MKKFFALVVAFFCAVCAASQSPLETAESLRNSVLSEYAQFVDLRARQSREFSVLAERDTVEINRLAAEIEESLRKSEEMCGGANALAALESEINGAVSEAASIASEFGLVAPSGLSYGRVADASKKVITDAIDFIVSPAAKKIDVRAETSTGEKIDGLKFSVGAFSYFIGGGTAGFLSDDMKLYGTCFSAQIRDFQNGKTFVIPADFSGGDFYREDFSRRGFLDEINAGGIWLIPILFFGMAAFAVFLKKVFSIFSVRKLDKKTLSKVFVQLRGGDLEKALNVAEKLGKPYAPMLSRLIGASKLGTAQIEEISYEYMLEVGEWLFSGLSVLSVTAAVAPLFGLLGTVTGIIKTFGDLSFHGAQQAQSISAGIGEALITTEYGLIVAIPAFVAHAILSRRAKAIMSDMEKLASEFLGKK